VPTGRGSFYLPTDPSSEIVVLLEPCEFHRWNPSLGNNCEGVRFRTVGSRRDTFRISHLSVSGMPVRSLAILVRAESPEGLRSAVQTGAQLKRSNAGTWQSSEPRG
jgi:hypothetical protein